MTSAKSNNPITDFCARSPAQKVKLVDTCPQAYTPYSQMLMTYSRMSNSLTR